MKLQPVSNKERIVSLDIIRGIALFGIMLINVPAYIFYTSDIPPIDYSGLNGVLHTLYLIFVEKKFFSIFSFLFGAGFYIFISRAEKRGDRYYVRYIRRLLALLVFGIIHIILWWGDILAFYAILGFFLLPFYKRRPRTILIWSGILTSLCGISLLGSMVLYQSNVQLLSIFSFFGNDAFVIFIMFLLGLYAAKTNLIAEVSTRIRTFKVTQAITLVLSVIFTLGVLWLNVKPEIEVVEFYKKSLISLGAIPMAVFYLTTLFRMLENKRVQKMFRPVGLVGQMAFTNYIGQDLIGGRIIIPLIGLQVISPLWALIIAIVIYMIQLIFSMIWLSYFSYGPLECVWRFLTYGKVRMKKS
ncbi:DUF418 domain-containing protein [Brevibacillus daliensis]|uniref:DUF418 domain-containing protein n=1 Tax=Brevibacillus daliensis TaxID=2892995 RepID=UPI001E38E4C6|nr:DUF418 domain-containing protein [Brevibacillus daliensis]